MVLNLDDALSALQHPQRRGERLFKDLPKAGIGGIANSEPDHRWRRTQTIKQRDEVGILGNDDCPSTPRGREDRRIRGIPQAEITHRISVDVKPRRQPSGERRREMGIQPERQAAITG